jgi:hypothetical protein
MLSDHVQIDEFIILAKELSKFAFYDLFTYFGQSTRPGNTL